MHLDYGPTSAPLSAIIVVAVIAWFWRAIARSCQDRQEITEEGTEAIAKMELDGISKQISDARSELTIHLQAQLANSNEERAKMRERIAKLEQSVDTC